MRAKGLACLALLSAAPAYAGSPVTFEASPSWQSAGIERIGGIVSGDVDADGHIDIVTAAYAGGSTPAPLETHVYFGGSAGLETENSWASDDARHSTSAGWIQLSGGVHPDLIIANGGAAEEPTVVYEHQAGALDTTPKWLFSNLDQGSTIDLAVGDVNGDGIPDVFLASTCYSPCPSAPIYGYSSPYDGTTLYPSWTSEETSQFGGVALGDPARNSVVIETYTTTGDGTQRVFWLPGAPVQRILRVLVDGDDPGALTYDNRWGMLHLATPPADGAEVAVLYERSDSLDLAAGARPGGILYYANSGTQLATTAIELGDTTDSFKTIVFADFDLDGAPELFAGGAGTGVPMQIFSPGTTGLQSTATWSSTSPEHSANDLAVADFNGDGFLDVVTVDFTNSTIVHVFVNDEGELETDASFTMPYASKSVGAVGAADVNNDGLPDLVLGYAGAQAEIYLNTGTPSAPPTIDAVEVAAGRPGQPTQLRIRGDAFRGPVQVWLGDEWVEDATVSSSTELLVDVPSGLAAGEHDVVVVNPGLRAVVAPGALLIEEGSGAEPDAGAVTPDAGSGTEQPAADEGGCGCRSSRSETDSQLPWLLFGLGLLALRVRFRAP